MLRRHVILAIQSHFFMVTSWSEEKQHSLDLFIEPHGVLAGGYYGAVSPIIMIFPPL
jgi:hypothetical protein